MPLAHKTKPTERTTIFATAEGFWLWEDANGAHTLHCAAQAGLPHTLAETSDPGSWAIGYKYRRVEPDALVGLLTSSDLFSGRTGGQGHKLFAWFKLTDATRLDLTYYLNNPTQSAPDDDYRRLPVDFKFKF